MIRVGQSVSAGFLFYATAIYIVFPIALSVVVSIVLIKFFPHFIKKRTLRSERKSSSYFLWLAIALYCTIFGTMSILRYLSFHSSIWDLGAFDHHIWNIAKLGDLKYLAFGHFNPVLGVYALFYRLFPSGIVLLVAQTLTIGLSAVPLYYIAKKKLGNGYYGLLVVTIFFLYSPVQYNNLSNFHPDHLFMLFMFLAFYFLEKNDVLGFLLISLAGLFVKETLILSVSMMGLYALIRYRMYKSGSLLFAGSLFFFFLVTNMIIPGATGAGYGGGFKGSFSYLGSDLFEIAKTLVFHPWIVLREAANVWKMGYLVFIFVPLLLIPLLSPLSLLPAAPALAISLLSRLPNYYWIQHHYTASVIPPVFISLIYGLKFLTYRQEWLRVCFQKLLKVDLSKNGVLEISLLTVLVVSLYYNIVLSPSPISIFFWKRFDSAFYSKGSYVITRRDQVLGQAIRRFIPPEASLSSQSSVNNSYLAHRVEYYSFPGKVGEVDYVVLDGKRPRLVGDRLDEERYEKEFEKLLNTYELIFSYDEIYIFRRKET